MQLKPEEHKTKCRLTALETDREYGKAGFPDLLFFFLGGGMFDLHIFYLTKEALFKRILIVIVPLMAATHGHISTHNTIM